LVLDEKISLCLSEEIFSEYIEDLNRSKFAKYADFKLNADVECAPLDFGVYIPLIKQPFS